MVLSTWIVAFAIGGLSKAEDPTGTYALVPERSPKASRSMASALFGTSLLRLNANGSFEFAGVSRSGFWRQHGERVVLVFDGFFTLAEAVPDDILRKRWPTHELDGLVFTWSQGELTLARHGVVRGPIVLKRRSRKSALELTLASQKDDAEGFAAFMEISDELPRRWPEFLALLKDPKLDFETKNWLAIQLKVSNDAVFLDSVIRFYNETKLIGKQKEIIRRQLRRGAASITDPALALKAFQAFAGSDDSYNLSRLATRVKESVSVPYLRKWAQSGGSWGRSHALDAIGSLRAKELYETAVSCLNAEEAEVRGAAAACVFRLSDSPVERKDMIVRLGSLLRTGDWLIRPNVPEWLAQTGSELAVPELVFALQGDEDAFIRRRAAEALGNLGSQSAIPALIEAKSRQDGPGSPPQESGVRKAAAEALWKFDKRRNR